MEEGCKAIAASIVIVEVDQLTLITDRVCAGPEFCDVQELLKVLELELLSRPFGDIPGGPPAGDVLFQAVQRSVLSSGFCGIHIICNAAFPDIVTQAG